MRKSASIVLIALCGSCSANDAVPSWPRLGPFCLDQPAYFDEPWAMAFLPDGNMLISEKSGRLLLSNMTGHGSRPVTGVPDVIHAGQGGLGEIVLHPQFEDNQLIYLSYAEAGEGDTAGAVVARAQLVQDRHGDGHLQGLEVIWRQMPKVSGRGHYGHRIVFDEAGYLWISSGERQKFDPAQDMNSNLGKIVRLHDDGRVPADNPFAGQGGVAAQVWSLGHRNPLGLAFDGKGRLWEVEMGPKGGDELNLIERGANYGYPLVSNGDHYDGRPIPDHTTRPEFVAPKVSWTPVISPSQLVIYSGNAYPQLRTGKQHAFISGLSSQALVHVEINDDGTAREVARYPTGKRIRSVIQGPDGVLWLLEDGKFGRRLKLNPIPEQGECPMPEPPAPF